MKRLARALFLPITFGLIAILPPSTASATTHGASQMVDVRAAAEQLTASHAKDRVRTAAASVRDSARADLARVRLSGFGTPVYSDTVALQDGSRSLVSVPLVGADFATGSNATLVYDSGKLVDYFEVVYVALDAHSGRAIVWHNGAIIFDKVATNDGTITDPSTPLKVKSFSYDKFQKCLNQHGVAAWAVSLAAVICGMGCTATFGMACALCFAGISFIAGGTIALCLGKAQQ